MIIDDCIGANERAKVTRSIKYVLQ